MIVKGHRKRIFFCFSVVVGRKHIQNIYLEVIKHTTNNHSSKCLAEQAHVLLKANPGRSLFEVSLSVCTLSDVRATKQTFLHSMLYHVFI